MVAPKKESVAQESVAPRFVRGGRSLDCPLCVNCQHFDPGVCGIAIVEQTLPKEE